MSGTKVFIPMIVPLLNTVNVTKKLFWKEIAEKKKTEFKKGINDYLFRVDQDDFLEDENDRISSLPYILFCQKHRIIPKFYFVEKTQV